MGPVLVLLPSPLLPASVWHPVARRLAEAGWQVAEVVDSQALTKQPSTAEQVRAWFLSAVPADRDVILLPHSNAGLYVPSLVAERRVAGYVFVDAALPPAAGDVRLAPEEFYGFLADKADSDGMLAPWTQWWDEDISGLFPSPEAREQVEREQRRMPLAYFAGTLPVPPGWDERPGAYLGFSQTYAAERAAAVARGWPTAVLDGQHLHQLVAPDQVAAEIQALLAQIGALTP
ncbi:MAG TPA: hypothetical protein VGB75_13085 [Jatrophihabitans sp.]|jgi:hypothetical protein|uniref:hypothetical protein n=1 Tax=Jatrophihabitans sp. TaxID=1932789 RepID=UPI002EF148F3